MRLFVRTILVTHILLIAVPQSWARKWTDSTGAYSTEAELVELKANEVVLKKTDGAVITIPIVRLSGVDRRHLESLKTPKPSQASVGKLVAEPFGEASGEDLGVDLEKGTIVTISAKGRPLGDVLAQIEASSGSKIRLVDEWGNDDKTTLAKTISLEIGGKLFWEAFETLRAATDLEFFGLKTGSLLLSTEASQFQKIEPVGEPVVVGAFQVFPGTNTFFDDLRIVVRPEPGIDSPRLIGYHADITLSGGNQVRDEPRFFFDPFNNLTGELTLRLEPEVPADTKNLQQVDFEARLGIPYGWGTFTLPPLAVLVPQSITVGEGTVRITQAESTSQPPEDEQQYAVELEVRGMELDYGKVALIDKAGNRIESKSKGSFTIKETQIISLGFDPSQVTGELNECQLALELPGAGKKTLGPLGEVASKSIATGAVAIRVSRAEMEDDPTEEDGFGVAIGVEGVVIPTDAVVLVNAEEKIIKSYARGGGGNSFQFWFRSSQLPDDPLACRLRVVAPTKVAEHVVRASFKDVPLPGE